MPAYQRNQLIATLCAKTMDYRGLGSGIIRALQSDCNIEFRNEVSGDQFRVILWRSDLKSKEETSQVESKEKSSLESGLESKEETSQVESKEKSSFESGLKSKEETPQVVDSKEKSSLESGLKSKEETPQVVDSEEKSSLESNLKSDLKVLGLLKQTPTLTIPQLQEIVGLSRSGIKKILNQLKESGRIRRVGPDKGGHWEICE